MRVQGPVIYERWITLYMHRIVTFLNRSRLAFFLQKRPVRCLLYNKFFNFHSPCKIFRIYIEHIIPQNLMFFVFDVANLAPKNYIIDTGGFLCLSE